MGSFLVEGGIDAAAFGWAGRVVVGRGAAGRGEGAAGGFGGVGCAVERPAVVGADRGGLASGGALSGSPVDPDGHVCAVDDHQGAHWLGIRDARAGGLRLASSAAVLSDRAGRARPGRVDGSQVDASAWWRGGGGADAVCDRQGPARDALPRESRADRLNGRRRRCAIQATRR